MRVCLDVQAAVSQLAGVGRYTRQLARYLALTANGNTLVLSYFDFKRKGAPFPAAEVECRPIRWIPGRVAQAAWKTLRWPPFDTLAGPADLYHFPNFVLPPLKTGKAVVSIHDLSFVRYPQFAEARNLRHLTGAIHGTVARADAIITISRFSASEICELLRVDAGLIFPIYPGVSEIFRPQPLERIHSVLKKLQLDRPYLLAVGTLEPRKNYAFLVDVFERLTDFDGDLVIAGGLGWRYEPILDRILNSPRRARIRHIAHADDSRLPALYAGAEALIMPSFYEGFGFPPVEAMACGAPVISSAGGSLKEVLQGAAVVIEGFDIAEWTAEIRKMFVDTAHRQKRIAAGYEHAAKFTWLETARRTWEVYRRIAD